VDAAREAIHIRHLLGEIRGIPVTDTIIIREDNQSTIAYSRKAMVSDKTKRIGTKYYFVKDHVAYGTIRRTYLPATEMAAGTSSS
jgi:hypothetical protein